MAVNTPAENMTDDRVQPMLLAQAKTRGAHDWSDRDVEPVIAGLLQELDFLRYFYEAAGDAFGPADSDVYRSINEDYEGVVPKGYSEDDVEEVWWAEGGHRRG